MGQLTQPLTEDQLNPIPIFSEMALQFRFRHGVEQLRDANDLLLVDQRGRTLRLTAPSSLWSPCCGAWARAAERFCL